MWRIYEYLLCTECINLLPCSCDIEKCDNAGLTWTCGPAFDLLTIGILGL